MLLKLQGLRLSLLGKELLPVDSVKDLGVSCDCNLTFNDHKIKTRFFLYVRPRSFGSKMFYRKKLLITFFCGKARGCNEG